MGGHVAIERRAGGALVVLHLTSPERRNALSSTMWRALVEFAEAAAQDESIRAILLRGHGGVFSAGADISDFGDGRSGAQAVATYDDLVESACRAIEAVPQPTLALIEGVCFGAGLSLAASCDLRLAADTAKLCVPAARLGLGYDIRGITRFNRVFGVAATTQLLLTADRMTAPRAHELGAIQFIAPVDEIEGVAHALTSRISENAPLTLRAAKLAQHALAHNDSALRERAEACRRFADASSDYMEGRAAFAEKRTPHFTGR